MVFQASPPMDVRTIQDAKEAETLLHTEATTLVLIYADWCGHCHTYLPQWKEFETIPRRNANIIKVHHDMMEHIPTIQKAKIQGYPSVIKVLPDGSMQEYNMEKTEPTHAIPYMRNKKEMIQEFTNAVPNSTVSNILPSALRRMKGGRRTYRSYRSLKRSTRRGSTRKHRRRTNERYLA